MKKKPEYIAVGRFGRPRGVSGEIYIQSLTDYPGRFRKGQTFWIEVKGAWEKLNTVSARIISGRPAVRFEHIDTPDEAARLTNEYLYIEASDLRELPPGTYYYFDLIDCEVLDENDRYYGRVIGVEEYPANDVLVIESNGGKSCLLPMVKEYVLEVDIENKKIIIAPPEGIFESSDES